MERERKRSRKAPVMALHERERERERVGPESLLLHCANDNQLRSIKREKRERKGHKQL